MQRSVALAIAYRLAYSVLQVQSNHKSDPYPSYPILSPESCIVCPVQQPTHHGTCVKPVRSFEYELERPSCGGVVSGGV